MFRFFGYRSFEPEYDTMKKMREREKAARERREKEREKAKEKGKETVPPPAGNAVPR